MRPHPQRGDHLGHDSGGDFLERGHVHLGLGAAGVAAAAVGRRRSGAYTRTRPLLSLMCAVCVAEITQYIPAKVLTSRCYLDEWNRPAGDAARAGADATEVNARSTTASITAAIVAAAAAAAAAEG